MAYSEEERTKRLLAAKENALTNVRKMVEKRHIHGELETIIYDGKSCRMRHYKSKRKNAPVYFDIHGGGFVWGMMEEGDLLCHHINEYLDFEVYALDYPLGPEVRYPVALLYLYDLINYMRKNADDFGFDSDRMLVGGRSAGGNLAAALCHLAKDRGEFQFKVQVLDHPYLDLCKIIDDSKRYSKDGVYDPSLMDELAAAYAGEMERKEIFVSPVNASANQLANLPSAVIQTCELDSLRLDGDLYAEKLASAGVKVIHHCYQGVEHGFTELEGEHEIPGQNWLIDQIKELI